MRSLFARIFLWFWVAMGVVVALLIVSSPLFTRSRPAVERWQRSGERWLAARLDLVVERVARGGPPPPGAGPHGERLGRVVFVLDHDGADPSGAPVPDDVAAFARRVAKADEELSERSGTLYLLGRPVEAPNGTRFVAVAAAHRPPRLIDLLEPRFLLWRLALLILIAGVLCLWLARYLTSPVTALRGTVRRLSGGDLSARVGAGLEGRSDEIGDLARDFNGMAARIEDLVTAQQRLVRDASHELRSPLARLAVALELARQRAGAPAHEALERIGREADRLEALVGQLLTLSRLEAAREGEEGEAVDLGPLLEEVIADAAFEAGGRGRRVVLSRESEGVVRGWAPHLRSAVENVVRNATRYTAPGSEVEVTLTQEDGEGGRQAVLRVRDHGPGVAERHLHAIFQPFFRADEARDRERGGVGLGLAIAARAVQLHGGSISACNHPGGGLEVTIHLPLTDVKPPP